MEPGIKNEFEEVCEACECEDRTSDIDTEPPMHKLIPGTEKVHIFMNFEGVPQIDFEADYKCTRCGRIHTHCETFISVQEYDWVL